MNYWKTLALQPKVLDILRVHSHNRRHHFGSPFLTPYQIAIEFRRLHPDDARQMGKEVGGKGAGDKHSLAQYFALELSKRVKKNNIPGLQGAFLHRKYLAALKYEDGNRSILSSAQGYDLSMFRLTE